MTLFVGIDVSSKDLEACLMDSMGETLATRKVKNDFPGATALRDMMFEYTNAEDPIHIGMEATSVYSWHPALFFHQDDTLNQRTTKVFTINPKLVKNFKKAYSEMDKTDPKDAWVIADRLRFGRLPKSLIQSEQFLALQRLTRMRYHLIQSLTREKQVFLNHLFFKCSAFNLEVDTSAFGHAITEFLLEAYSLDEIAQMPLEDLAGYLQAKGRGRFSDPEDLAASIQKAARSSYRLSKCVEDSIDLILGSSIEIIRHLQRQIKDLDKAIARVLDGIPNTLKTIPGLGFVSCAGILAEIGDIDRFDHQAAIAKFAGLFWPRSQSGDYEADDKKLARTGNRYLRYYLIEAANQVRRQEPNYRAFYNKKFREVQKHQHKRALVLTARKLVRLIDALLRNDQIYAPNKKVTR
ncbi:IS110 family transposase [Virgibacillus sp. JSM 102003]|uniref:IS110 family transposase n=1 Tax=Virgibacillus sp. JSM 102003 TaxID=1562108 RepID=UPI0035BED290